jgi:hypothetical protein
VFSTWFLFINTQSTVPPTVHTVAPTVTVAATTMSPTTVPVKTEHTTVPLTVNPVTMVSNKAFTPVYVEPPPHPLGYCIRSRLRCSRIRRCCGGPCDVIRMKCP